MKGIILAAGRGSRMGSLTSNLPKCRTHFFGKDLIEWQLDALKNAGITEIAIVTGYLNETFDFPVTFFHNKRWAETNMVMSLMCAKEWLENDDCIISYSDICYSESPVKSLIKDDSDFSISYDPDWLKLWSIRMEDPLSDAETFKLNQNSELLEIGNKSNSIIDIQGQYMGLVKITPNSFTAIEDLLDQKTSKEQDSLDFTNLLNTLIQKGVNIKGIPISDQWYEVDTEEDLKAYLAWKTKENIFSKD